jgi:hypothetical protein
VDGTGYQRQKIEMQPELVKSVLRSVRDAAADIRRDKNGVVAYIERGFKVTPNVAAEAYEDINGVIVENLVMPDEKLKSSWTKLAAEARLRSLWPSAMHSICR